MLRIMAILEKSKSSLTKNTIFILSAIILYFGVFEVNIKEVDAAAIVSMNCSATSTISYKGHGLGAGVHYELSLFKMGDNTATLINKTNGKTTTSGETLGVKSPISGKGTYMAVLHARSGNYQYANATCTK